MSYKYVYFLACESLGAGQKRKFNVMMDRCHSYYSYCATGRILDPGHLRARRVGFLRIFKGLICYGYHNIKQEGRREGKNGVGLTFLSIVSYCTICCFYFPLVGNA